MTAPVDYRGEMEALRTELVERLRAEARDVNYYRTVARRLGSSWRVRFADRKSVPRVRGLIRRIRALDAVMEHARDRDYMARVWMYIACGLTQAEAANRARAEMAAQEPRR